MDGDDLDDRRRPTPTAAAARYLPWRPATPRDGESVRWECIDDENGYRAIVDGYHTNVPLPTSCRGLSSSVMDANRPESVPG